MELRGLKSILKNASFLLGGRLITIISRGIYAIVLARTLGPEIYGLFNYAMSWYLVFLPLVVLGLEEYLSREIGKNRQKGERIVSTSYSLRLILMFSVAIICAITGWFVEDNENIKILLLS